MNFGYIEERTDEYQDRLKYAWLRFINNENFDYSFMRPEIYEAWQVSRYYKVDPYELTYTRLTLEELEKHRLRHDNLVRAAKPEIEKLYSIIAGSNIYIILTDGEGIVLDSVGDKKNLILSGLYTRLTPGSSWNISEAGSSSISLCLSTKKPFQIYGAEHYKYHYKTHTCSGAPIFDAKQNIIGTINISGLRHEVNSHTLGMIVNVAKSIEQSMKLKDVYTELSSLHTSRKSTHDFRTKYTFDSIVGDSSTLSQAIKDAKTAAKNLSNILLTGESGTGKEVFAHAIHNASSRRDGPFVAINCGAIPRSLVESELFGYERGAFTGGKKDGAPGKFELAEGGTLFLDEIGEMPLDIQVSLLRVLETKEVVRVGGTKNIPLNVRIIAAGNKDLHQAVLDKTFREDLYYRLNVFQINIPPLRSREKDIIALADFFVNRFNTGTEAIHISDDVYPVLLSYAWPGNVRELSNVMERAVLVHENNLITRESLPQPLCSINVPSAYHSAAMTAPLAPSASPLSDYEHDLLVSELIISNGKVEITAERLGMNSRTLYRKLKKYGISAKKYRIL